jgi:peptidoglycan-associated lipoprotein
MRQSAVIVALVAAVAFAGCGKKTPPPAPAPPPAAPSTPPPAPPPPPAPSAPAQSDYDRIKGMSADEIDRMGLLADIHFDYDKSDIRGSETPILTKNAEALKKFDFLRITVEGHCDERGTVEYNLALGERRSKAALDYLVSLGVPADRMKSVSYGKEVPLCQEKTEDCWARNRRAKFTVTGKTTGR